MTRPLFFFFFEFVGHIRRDTFINSVIGLMREDAWIFFIEIKKIVDDYCETMKIELASFT